MEEFSRINLNIFHNVISYFFKENWMLFTSIFHINKFFYAIHFNLHRFFLLNLLNQLCSTAWVLYTVEWKVPQLLTWCSLPFFFFQWNFSRFLKMYNWLKYRFQKFLSQSFTIPCILFSRNFIHLVSIVEVIHFIVQNSKIYQ